MRTFSVVVLVSLSAVVAGAQTRVAVTRVDTSFGVYRSGAMTPTQLRSLVSDLNALQMKQRSLEEQLERLRQSDGPPQQIEAVQRQLEQTMAQFFPRQSALTLVCQSVLASEVRSQGYLGLQFDEEITMTQTRPGVAEIAVRFTGAPRIIAVEPGSPASRAGVRVGDEWVALGSRKLDGATVEDLDALLKPGSRQVLRLRRDGRERDLDVVVGKREEFPTSECAQASERVMFAPLMERAMAESMREAAITMRGAPVAVPRVPQPPQPPRATYSFMSATTPTVYGATFRALDADVRDFIGYSGDGIYVDRVVAGTQAEKAGLMYGDVVVRVNGATVTSPQVLARTLQETRRNELIVQRKGTTRTVVLER